MTSLATDVADFGTPDPVAMSRHIDRVVHKELQQDNGLEFSLTTKAYADSVMMKALDRYANKSLDVYLMTVPLEFIKAKIHSDLHPAIEARYQLLKEKAEAKSEKGSAEFVAYTINPREGTTIQRIHELMQDMYKKEHNRMKFIKGNHYSFENRNYEDPDSPEGLHVHGVIHQIDMPLSKTKQKFFEKFSEVCGQPLTSTIKCKIVTGLLGWLEYIAGKKASHKMYNVMEDKKWRKANNIANSYTYGTFVPEKNLPAFRQPDVLPKPKISITIRPSSNNIEQKEAKIAELSDEEGDEEVPQTSDKIDTDEEIEEYKFALTDTFRKDNFGNPKWEFSYNLFNKKYGDKYILVDIDEYIKDCQILELDQSDDDDDDISSS